MPETLKITKSDTFTFSLPCICEISDFTVQVIDQEKKGGKILEYKALDVYEEFGKKLTKKIQYTTSVQEFDVYPYAAGIGMPPGFSASYPTGNSITVQISWTPFSEPPATPAGGDSSDGTTTAPITYSTEYLEYLELKKAGFNRKCIDGKHVKAYGKVIKAKDRIIDSLIPDRESADKRGAYVIQNTGKAFNEVEIETAFNLQVKEGKTIFVDISKENISGVFQVKKRKMVISASENSYKLVFNNINRGI